MYKPTYLRRTYLPTYLPTHSSSFESPRVALSSYLPTYRPTYLPTYLHIDSGDTWGKLSTKSTEIVGYPHLYDIDKLLLHLSALGPTAL